MTRRRWLSAALIVSLALVAAACGGASGPGASAAASAAPSVAAPSVATPSASVSADVAACTAPATPTPAQTEGPYFTAGSPEKASLVEPGMNGTPLTLTGFVVTTACAPIAGAKVDVWQADASGVYDNAGHRLRGYVVTDETGRFTIQTIVPGEYPGRTEHIHVKVTPSGGDTLTTQLYFPGVSANDADGIYSPEMLLDVTPQADGFVGTFTFVLAV
jgi:protocatechuate 3,4-dioxygenase beta subunit